MRRSGIKRTKIALNRGWIWNIELRIKGGLKCSVADVGKIQSGLDIEVVILRHNLGHLN